MGLGQERIEGFWSGYLDCELRPLNDEEMKFLMHITLLSKRGPVHPEMLIELRKQFIFSIIERRLSVFSRNGDLKPEAVLLDAKQNELAGCPDIDPFAILWCSSLARQPGDAVVWAYTLWLLWRRTGERVTIDTLIEAFPNGIPTEDERKRVWDSQKQHGSNYPQNYMDDLERWPKEVPEDKGILTARQRNRAEHLEHCKQLAYNALEETNDSANCFCLFANEMNKHKETRRHSAIELGMMLLLNGDIQPVDEMRKFIRGFN
jgi:hypothetical protein